MTSPDRLRRDAKALKRGFAAGDLDCIARIHAVFPDFVSARHAYALHVVARENGFESWPKLKLAAELAGMDEQAKAERLKIALFFGQHWVVERLLSETPTLGDANFGLQCALYRVDSVRDTLDRDGAAATRLVGIRSPILHLCFSQHFKGQGRIDEALAVAELLVAHGGEVNDSYAAELDTEHRLSALYGALGHGGNLALAEWLLERGADPNDNESLYHATELGHLDGVRLLLRYGVEIDGTNALPRMLDFNNLEGVRLLLDHGADPNEGIAEHFSGEPAMVIPALHQAARRMCSGDIAQLLIDRGADGRTPFNGHSAYALARMRGNKAIATTLEEAGQATPLDPAESLLARAADGPVSGTISEDALTAETRRIIGRILSVDGSLDHVKRLVALGIDPDWTDEMGLPAIHIAGWEGQSEVVEWLLTLGPDLDVENGYGGDLLGTIIHGSEFCPNRAQRDHLRCAELVLAAGATLRRREIDLAGNPDMAVLLEDWADTHPAQLAD